MDRSALQWRLWKTTSKTPIISLYGTVPDSIVDGPGLRYAVFVQGCSHHCPGCHNPESQPAEGGTETTLAALLADIRANGLVHDVTLSGGEPFEQPEACAALAAALKREGYGVWSCSVIYEDLATRAKPAPRSPDRGTRQRALHENLRRWSVGLSPIANLPWDLLDSTHCARRRPLRGIAQVPRAEVVRLLQPAPDRPTGHTTCRLRRGMATRLVFAGETLQLVGEHLFEAMTDKSFRVFGTTFWKSLSADG